METLSRRLGAVLLGTAGLLAVNVGSGHMGHMLSPDNDAVALLANSAATGTGLAVLITLFTPVSGAHFNPLVSLAAWWRGELRHGDAALYICAQILGAFAGVLAAHAMFDLALFEISIRVRDGGGQALSEVIASAGLLLVILLGQRARTDAVPLLVGAWIACAHWFTSSTALANPAVTIARMFTATFTGIRPHDVPLFVVSELAGLIVALLVLRAFEPRRNQRGR